MITCHCIAHRHALACADAAHGNKACEYFEAIVHDIVSYHSHSTKRHEHLEKLQAQLGIAQLRLVAMVATRWLSRGQTVARIYAIIAALVLEFSEDARDGSNALAAPLVVAVACSKFMMCLALYNDVLTLLNQLSAYFQKSHVVFREVKELLEATKMALKAQYIDEPFVGGASFVAWSASAAAARRAHAAAAAAHAAANDGEEPRAVAQIFAPPELKYNHQGVTDLVYDAATEKWAMENARSFATTIIKKLDARFPDVELFDALAVFDYTVWPADLPGNFGDEKIEQLIEHYGKPQLNKAQILHPRVVDGIAVRTQWAAFKQILKMHKNKGDSLEDTAREVLSSSTLPDVKILYAISLVLCLSTVWCERGFSLMAIIKTKLRNCMNIETLDALMMIASNAPNLSDHEAVEALLEEAYEHWRTKQKRCLARSHPGVKHASKKKKRATIPLSDLLHEQAKQARRERRCDVRLDSDDDGTDDDDDEDDVMETGDASGASGGGDASGASGEGGDDAAAAGRMSQTTTDALQAAAGAYNPPPGWSIDPKPAASQEDWTQQIARMKKGSAFWRNKRLVHVFDDGYAACACARLWGTESEARAAARSPRRWDEGTFQHRERSHLVFYYKSDNTKYAHSLDLDEWGVAKSWLVITQS